MVGYFYLVNKQAWHLQLVSCLVIKNQEKPSILQIQSNTTGEQEPLSNCVIERIHQVLGNVVCSFKLKEQEFNFTNIWVKFRQQTRLVAWFSCPLMPFFFRAVLWLWSVWQERFCLDNLEGLHFLCYFLFWVYCLMPDGLSRPWLPCSGWLVTPSWSTWNTSLPVQWEVLLIL